MKKILFMIPTLGGGGAEKSLVNLVNAMDRDKYDISVLMLFDTGVRRDEIAPHVRLIHVFKRMFRANSYIFRIFSPEFLFRKFVTEDYDMVISYLEGNTCRIASGCTAAETGKITWQHTAVENRRDLVRPVYRSLREARAVYGSFDEVAAVSAAVRESLENVLGIGNDIRVLYNPVDSMEIRRLSEEPAEDGFPDRGIDIISVGRLNKTKGYGRLIDVFRRLVDETPHGPELRLHIIGQGGQERKLRKKIGKLGLEGRVFLMGYRPNPYKYMKDADFFVSSSFVEGFSTVVSEALILGIPVVAADCSGMTEILGKNDEYGIIAKNSEEGLFEAMNRILSGPGLLEHYRKQAEIRGRIFGIENAVRAIEDFIDDAFDRRGHAG
ncbi:MAG: glycosyltransferase [Clostridia bacterium]|nr:glycosyltransferase [Clostridia bacterium]